MKLIKLSDTHYIVVDDSEIGEGDYVYFKGRIIGSNILKVHLTEDDGYTLLDDKGLKVLVHKNTTPKITHSTQPISCNCAVNNRSLDLNCTERNHCFDNVKYISLKEIEEVVYGYSVEKMAMSYLDRNYNLSYERTTWQKLHEKTFEAGFNAHKELTKDKLFTEKHMKMIFAYAHTIGMNTILQIQSPHLLHKQDTHKLRDEFIQSLFPKTEWEVEFDEQGKLRLI